MWSDTQVVSLGHSGDDFCFHDSTSIPYVRLYDGCSFCLEYLSEAMARVDTLANRDRHGNVVRNTLQCADIECIRRLLDPRDFKLLEPSAQANGLVRCKAAAEI